MPEREWPFEWLSSERIAVRAAAESGIRRGLAIVGGAGLGKTALARQWLARSPGPGLWFAATQASRGVPFSVFAGLLDGVAPGTASELVAARAAIIERGQDVWIVVDDAHELDPASAVFLHGLVVDEIAQVLVTVRTEADTPDAVRALWKDDLVDRVDLRSLDRGDSALLCASALGGDLEPRTLEALHTASGGSPFLLRRLVESTAATGALVRVGTRWRLERAIELDRRLDEFLAAELAALDEPSREVAALVALGEPVRLSELERIASTAAIEAAEAARVVALDRAADPTVRMAHPLVGEHIRAHLGEMRARRLRGRLIDAALADGLSPADATRVAVLSLASDRPAPPRLIEDAARRAVALSDLEVGERLARAAVDGGAGFEAAIMLAHALSWQGKGAEAEALLAGVVPSSPVELVTWTIPRVANRFWTMRDARGARDILARVVAELPDPVLRAGVDAMDAAMSLHDGDLDRALRLTADVLARDGIAPPGAVWAGGTRSIAQAMAGRSAEVPALVERTRAIASEFDTGFVGYAAEIGAALAAVLGGPTSSHAVSAAEGSPPPSALWAAGTEAMCAGIVKAASGLLAPAADLLAASADAMETADVNGWFVLARAVQIETLVLLGRVDEAATAMAALDETPSVAHGLLTPMQEVARSALVAATGEVSTAIGLARAAARRASRGGQHAVAAAALHRALRMGDGSVAGSLGETAARCDGPLPHAMAEHAYGIARRDGAFVAAASRRFEELGFPVLAIDAAVDAAELFARNGHGERESEQRLRVNELDAALGHPLTPALVRHRAPLPLTAREREVARLVGAGLSNREIAQRLSVSVRTVEGHVYHACLKLDLPNKRALAAARIDAVA